MSRSSAEYLNDILGSIDLVLRYADAFDVRNPTDSGEGRDAISFRLVVVCEAAGRLPPDVQALAPDIPWADIKGMRNLIVHSYWHIDFDIIATTLQNDIPPFRSTIERLLEIIERSEK